MPKGCDLREVGASLERVPNGNDGVVGNPAIRNVPLGILKAQIYGSRLVAWAKRAKAKMMCCSSPGETVLAVNHTAVDRTICFHDSTSGRLLNRVALICRFGICQKWRKHCSRGGLLCWPRKTLRIVQL